MAASVTITEKNVGSVKKVTFAWTAAADGSASKATTYAYDGQILGLATIPGSGGDAPTDNYDLTLTDADGHDVLLGQGANRDTANTEYVASTSLAGVAGSKLTLNVSNAGDSKKGVAVVWIR